MRGTVWTPRRARLMVAVLIVLAVCGAVALVLNAFQSNLVFFFTPTQVRQHEAPLHRTFRLGGLVQAGSVQRDGLQVRFAITDMAHTVPVRYEGLLPDLFQEGKGVVVQGRLDAAGRLHAHEVLAKHDENYMPPEAAEALARAAPEARP
ncbi:cytochrome c maturation protein CcmE [Aquabacterium sp. A3]|uniref:cytochrome c maturation protein CcmE n=1 Tax=Aquabacterium sp. A3 TaxID=3132829 RepID=UPI00311A9139